MAITTALLVAIYRKKEKRWLYVAIILPYIGIRFFGVSV